MSNDKIKIIFYGHKISKILASGLSSESYVYLKPDSNKFCQHSRINFHDLWCIHLQAYEELIKANQMTALVVNLDVRISIKKLIRTISGLNRPNLEKIDLFQFRHKNKLGFILKPVYDSHRGIDDLSKWIGPFLHKIEFLYVLWILITHGTANLLVNMRNFSTRIRHPIIGSAATYLTKSFIFTSRIYRIVVDKKILRKYLGLNSQLVSHSFERGTDAYLISNRLAHVVSQVNKDFLLPPELFFQGIARSQNIVSLRALRNEF
jgi:hypothetical protein